MMERKEEHHDDIEVTGATFVGKGRALQISALRKGDGAIRICLTPGRMKPGRLADRADFTAERDPVYIVHGNWKQKKVKKGEIVIQVDDVDAAIVEFSRQLSPLVSGSGYDKSEGLIKRIRRFLETGQRE